MLAALAIALVSGLVFASPAANIAHGLSIDILTALRWRIFGQRHTPESAPGVPDLSKAFAGGKSIRRVGDSVTNVITPLNFYFPILLAAVTRYVPDTRIGTLLATMLPYSLAFLAAWTVLLLVWIALGWPLGPGSPLTYIVARG